MASVLYYTSGFQHLGEKSEAIEAAIRALPAPGAGTRTSWGSNPMSSAIPGMAGVACGCRQGSI
ncbi:MAG: hypothetical protein ACLP3B_22415 [Syntrophobacteraceae bacterium]